MTRSIHDLTTTLAEECSATPGQLSELLEFNARQLAGIDGIALDVASMDDEFADHLLDVIRMGLGGKKAVV